VGIKLNNPQFAQIDRPRIAYHRRGSGPSVVLHHGISTSSYLGPNIIPLLVHEGVQVIAVDLPW
jgi:pimeloyl-ACP methyl ester carboxylesterase